VAWRRLDDAPTKPDDVRAWLFGIARHCLLNTRRGQGRRDALAVRVAETVPSARVADELTADPVAQRLDLAAAWRRLSETDQEALSLTVFEDLTSPQAARVLGITSAAYRLRLLRARRALRRQLDLAEFPSYVPKEIQS
jgi:RNA polymerase sigma-70 factor (ECF subfamily)